MNLVGFLTNARWRSYLINFSSSFSSNLISFLISFQHSLMQSIIAYWILQTGLYIIFIVWQKRFGNSCNLLAVSINSQNIFSHSLAGKMCPTQAIGSYRYWIIYFLLFTCKLNFDTPSFELMEVKNCVNVDAAKMA